MATADYKVRKKITLAKAQENLYSHNVLRRIAEVNSKDMGTIYNPYTSFPTVNDGTASTASYSIGDYTADADILQVNRRSDASEHVNSYDWKSVNFGLIADRGANYGKAISQNIDRYGLNSVIGKGGFALDDGNFGSGTPTNPLTVSDSNIDDLVNTVIEEIDVNNGHDGKKFLVISPREASHLRGFLQNSGNAVADDVIRGGIPFVGTTFSGVDIYQTNNLTNEVKLTVGAVQTDGKTFTLNGVTWTFRASATLPGEVEFGASKAASQTNLVNALKGTTGAHVALDNDDKGKISQLKLDVTISGDVITIKALGTITASQDLASGSLGSVARYLVGGNYGSLYLALPTQGIDYHEKEVSGKAGVELYTEQFYNTTIWTRKVPLIGTVYVK